jgi:hypothetical protein
MVHAPTAGDVVRVAPVWWAEFFGATRVLGAVPGPGGGPTITAALSVPVSRAAPDPSPGSGRPPAAPERSASVAARNPPSGGPATGRALAVAGDVPPAGRGRAACPAAGPGADRPAAGTAASVTGLVTGVLGGLLGPTPGDAIAEAYAVRTGAGEDHAQAVDAASTRATSHG